MSVGGKTNTLQTIFATKKLLGKANTSILADPNVESIGTNLQLATSIIFGQTIPEDPSGSYAGLPSTLPATYSIATNSLAQPVAEYVRLTLTSIAGSTYDADGVTVDGLPGGTGTSESGPHSYAASLPSDYSAETSNVKATANSDFTSSQVLNETAGGVQIIQNNFSTLAPNPYQPKLYESDGTTEILLDDFSDWIVDAFAGIVYVQDYDSSAVPAFLDTWIYIGDMANATAAGAGHTIHTSSISTAYSQRTKLVFTGSAVESVTDDSGNDATVVKLTGQAGNLFGNIQFVSASNTFNNNADSSNDTLTINAGPGIIFAQTADDNMVISASATAFGTKTGSLQFIDNGALRSSINLSYIDTTQQLQITGSLKLTGNLSVDSDPIWELHGESGSVDWVPVRVGATNTTPYIQIGDYDQTIMDSYIDINRTQIKLMPGNGFVSTICFEPTQMIPGDADNVYDLGSITKRWKAVHAAEFTGSLSGSFQGHIDGGNF